MLMFINNTKLGAYFQRLFNVLELQIEKSLQTKYVVGFVLCSFHPSTINPLPNDKF